MAGCAAGVAPGAEVDARLMDRYRELLEARPEPGVVLERLWEAAEPEALLMEYSQRAESGDAIAALVLGHLLQHAGRNTEALDAFLQAAELDGSRSDAWEAAAMLARETGDMESAAQYLDRAESALNAEDAEGRVRILTGRGRILVGLGKIDEAAEAWESAMAEDPGNGVLRQTLVEQYMRAGMWGAAHKHLEFLAASRSPEVRVGAMQQLASLEVERGDAPAAIDVLESALDLTAPGNWMRMGVVRDLARIAENADLTATIFSRWEEHAGDTERMLRLMEFAHALGDTGKELLWLERYLERSQELPGMAQRRAELLTAVGRHAEAADIRHALWQASRGDAALAFAAAESMVQADRTDSALEVLEAWAPHSGDAHRQITAFLRTQNLTDALEAMLVRHMEADADNQEALLELVRFYAEHEDLEQAAKVLEAGVANNSDLLAAGVRIFLDRDALSLAKHFLDMADGVPELLLLSGEWEERSGNFEVAVKILEDARAWSTDPESVDRRIWNVLRAWEDTVAKGDSARRLPWEPEKVDIKAIMDGVEADADRAASPMAAYLEKITAAADKPEEWMRVAEWWLRAGNYLQAVDAAGKALAAGAEPVKVRGLLAGAAMSQVEPEVAIVQLRLLINEDPEGADHYREQLAKLVAETSGPDAALELLDVDGDIGSKIARAEVLQDTQRWFEAVEAWKTLLREVPQNQRARVVEQLATGLERTGRAREAVEILWKEVAGQPAGTDRSARHAALEAFAGRHGMRAQVAKLYQTAAAQSPQDFTLQLETASALRLAEDREAAVAMLPSLYRLAGTDPGQLDALAREAEALGDGAMAVRVQRQLIAQDASPDVADFEKLAAAQLSLMDMAAATKTYHELVLRYPRNADALVRAAAFFEKAGQIHEALPLRKKAAGLAPDDAENIRELGEWLLIRSEDMLAVALWESVLARPSARDVEKLILPPVPTEVLQQMRVGGHIAARSRGGGYIFSVVPPSALQSGGVLDRDLEAVAHMAMLHQRSGNEDSLKTWLEEMEGKDLSMAAWAFYYAGRGSAFGRLVFEELKGSLPSDEAVQKAIWLTLESGGAEAVGAWMMDQAEPDAAEMVLNALRILARRMPEAITAELMEQLFPPGMEDAETLWQAAQVCAGVARYEAAMHPGMRVLELSRANQAIYAYELGMWTLWRGDRREALRLFRLGLDGQMDGFASVPVAAWRACFYLLPEEDREGFVESVPSLLGTRMDSAEGDLVLALMEGLQGRNDAAMLHLRKRQSRAAMISTPEAWGNAAEEQAVRYWNQIFAGAVRLEEWGMYALARNLLDLALEDQARIRLHGEAAAAVIAECRLRATSLGVFEYALAERDWTQPAPELPGLQFSTRQMDQLESFGMLRFALPVAGRELEQSPTDLSVLFAYMKAARAAGLFVEPGERVRNILETQEFIFPERVQASLGLAFLWGQFGQMQRVVDFLDENSPALPVLIQLMDAHQALGNETRANALLAQIGPNPEAAVALRLQAAEAIAEENLELALGIAREVQPVGEAKHAAAVMRLFVKTNADADVRKFLEAVFAQGNPAVVAAVLDVLAEDLPGFDLAAARRIAMVRTQTRGQRVKIFKDYLRGRSSDISMQDLENSYALALRAGNQEAEVIRFFMEHVEDANLLAEIRLHAEWQDGRGMGGLEFVLAEWYARTGETEKLEDVVEQFLERPSVSRRRFGLMLESLSRHECFEAAIPVAERLVREFSDDIPGHVQLIRFLKECDEGDKALDHLELLRSWVIANPMVPREFAKEFENQGLMDEAEIMHEDAMRTVSPSNSLQVAKDQVEFLIRTRQIEKLVVAFPRFISQFGSRDDLDLLRRYRESTGPGEASIHGLTPDVQKALGEAGN